MSDSLYFRFAPVLIAAACMGLSGCGSFSGSRAVMTMLSPYKIDKVQGNVVTREQLAFLKTGMPKAAVKDILGTPLLTSVFHSDRWDYVFTFSRQGAEPQMRRVAVFFTGDTLSKTEADELPSEAEFVSSLKSIAQTDNLPPMVASEEALKKFPPPVPVPPEPVVPAAPVDYPPLEKSR